MCIDLYRSLQEQSKKETALWGMVLPTLSRATLVIDNQTLSSRAAIDKVAEFGATQGWVMYRDELVISDQAPERADFIEAEYNQGNHSLTVKLIGDDLYSVSRYTCDQTSTDSSMVYKEQNVYLRNNLAGGQTATYRIWYRQETKDDCKCGRWEAYAQQFISINQVKERSHV